MNVIEQTHDIEYARKMLGHANLEMTMRFYNHATDGAAKRVRSAMEGRTRLQPSQCPTWPIRTPREVRIWLSSISQDILATPATKGVAAGLYAEPASHVSLELIDASLAANLPI